jgi:hypothetical protein
MVEIKCCRVLNRKSLINGIQCLIELQVDNGIIFPVLNPSKLISPFVFSSSVLVLILGTGCAKKPFAVEVAHGFTGYVHILCGPTVGFPSQPVQVNSLGGADAESCPGRDAEVTMLRDGKMITATAVNWERTGDGTPVALSFSVE